MSRTSLLDLPPQTGARRSLVAGASAALLHGGLGILALTVGVRVAQKVTQPDVAELIEVELPVPKVEAPIEKITNEPTPEPMDKVKLPMLSETPKPTAETETEPPPAPAEAGEVLTTDNEIIDFGTTIISGKSDRFAGGLSSSEGTQKKAVRNENARSGGAFGGTGSGRPVSAAPAPNHSRSPKLAGGAQWDCPFPPEADHEQINNATVSLQVQVAPNGKVESVAVANDPGFGFGREARRCALRKSWDPGLDERGAPTGATARIKVRFAR